MARAWRRSSSALDRHSRCHRESPVGQVSLADRGLSTAIYLSLTLPQPLLLEGEAGVGKTEVAKALAGGLGIDLIRLQCYEGIDANQALYEWDYPRQLLYLRRAAEADPDAGDEDELFAERFLVERPLLKAIRSGSGCVLLIDEIDRADDEFETFLLEILYKFQITIPEIGTVRAPLPVPLDRFPEPGAGGGDSYRPRAGRAATAGPEHQPGGVQIARAGTRQAAWSGRDHQLVSGFEPTGRGPRDSRLLDISLGSVIKDHDDLATVRGRAAEILDGI